MESHQDTKTSERCFPACSCPCLIPAPLTSASTKTLVCSRPRRIPAPLTSLVCCRPCLIPAPLTSASTKTLERLETFVPLYKSLLLLTTMSDPCV